MQKLLIADSSQVFIDALTAALQGQFHIRTCTDGNVLVDLLPDYHPDILILNLLLPHVDGMTILRTCPYQPSVILAVTTYISSFIERNLVDLGVDYTLIAPSISTVVSQLRSLLESYTPPPASAGIQEKVAYHLRLLGVPSHLDGYRQLLLSLPMFAQNPQQRLTKELYPEVAKLSEGKDARSVEHSIRTAIHAAWLRRDNAVWRKYFSLGSQGAIPCPTNKEFLCRLAELLNAEESMP